MYSSLSEVAECGRDSCGGPAPVDCRPDDERQYNSYYRYRYTIASYDERYIIATIGLQAGRRKSIDSISSRNKTI